MSGTITMFREALRIGARSMDATSNADGFLMVTLSSAAEQLFSGWQFLPKNEVILKICSSEVRPFFVPC